MNNSFVLRGVVLFIVTCISAVTDLFSGRIKNMVLGLGLIPILFYHLIFQTSFLTREFAYQILLTFLLFIFFKMRLMGGGDVKLYGFVALSFPDGFGLSVAVLSIFMAAIAELSRILVTLVLAKSKSYLIKTGPSMPEMGSTLLKTRRSLVCGTSRRGAAMGVYVFLAVITVLFSKGGIVWTG